MHILQMISKNDRYGAQRIFLDQVAVLHGMGHRITVIGCATDGYVSDSVRAMGIPYHGISWRKISDIFFLKKLIKDSGVDIIHTTLDRADYVGMLLCRLTRRPMVSTMMTLRCHHGYRIMKDVVVLSKKQQILLDSKTIWSARISVIRPGIDVQRFTHPDKERQSFWKRQLKTDNFSIIFCHVSNLLPRKAHLASLELMVACKKRGENPLLIIIGDPLKGEYYETLLRRIAELEIRDNVCFTGWTADLPEILSLSHFSTLPSDHEALGVVLMEGMAAGTPIIAREGEGGAELVDEYGSGFLYRPEEGVDILAEELLRLHRDPVRYQALSDACKKTAEEEFTLSRFGERLVALYNRCGVSSGSGAGKT